MNRSTPLADEISSAVTAISRPSLRPGFRIVLLVLALAWFALSLSTQAVSPAPDGGYPIANTAEGDFALASLTSGEADTAIGHAALFSNTTGGSNTALGANALQSDTTGSGNTATGASALINNSTGMNNTANGYFALLNNNADNNTASGFLALFSNTTGGNNTASGVDALLSNTTGSNNIGFGFLAGSKLTSGSNNIDIGANVPGVAGEANTIRIGKSGTQKKTFIAGIRGVTVASGVGVIVSSSGQLGTVLSSARFKEAIRPMDTASEATLALQPVTFRYKHELDPDGVPQFGLVAEQVEKVNPDLVVRDEDGKVNTVRYEVVNAMLLNEFLKEHRKVEEQEARLTRQEVTMTQLKSAVAQQKDFAVTIAQQQKQIETLTATLQKVSEQVAFSKPAPQLVANP